jgi:hypothetical protein
MTELERYKSAVQKYRFIVQLWLDEDCGCPCGQCEEMIEEAEELLRGKAEETK